MNRLFVLFALWLIAAFTGAAPPYRNNVLLLIQPAAISGLDAPEYHTGAWVLWGAMDGRSSNQLLSVGSGLNWRAFTGTAGFLPSADGFRLDADRELQSAGYYEAVAQLNGAPRVALAGSLDLSRAALLVAKTGPGPIRAITPGDRWPAGSTVVAQAHDWDDVKRFQSQTVGRVVVLEYPPASGRRWGRLWTFPSGGSMPVESTLNVPNLIPASAVIAYVEGRLPVTVQGERTGALRWLQFGETVAPIVLGVWSMLVAALVVISLRTLMMERGSLTWSVLMEVALLLPAANLVAGAICRGIGPSAFPELFPLTGIGLWLVFRVIPRIRSAHPLWFIAWIGLVCALGLSATWSATSPVFGMGEDPSLGVTFGYGFAVSALGPQFSRWRWIWNVAPAIGIFLIHPTAEAALATVPMAMLACHWLDPKRLALAMLGAALALALRHGYAFMPHGLISNLNQRNAINSEDYLLFALSPLTLGTLSIAGLMTVFGDRFGLYLMHRLIQQDDRRAAMLNYAGVIAAVGLIFPALLMPALVLAIAGVMILLRDGLIEAQPVLAT